MTFGFLFTCKKKKKNRTKFTVAAPFNINNIFNNDHRYAASFTRAKEPLLSQTLIANDFNFFWKQSWSVIVQTLNDFPYNYVHEYGRLLLRFCDRLSTEMRSISKQICCENKYVLVHYNICIRLLYITRNRATLDTNSFRYNGISIMKSVSTYFRIFREFRFENV